VTLLGSLQQLEAVASTAAAELNIVAGFRSYGLCDREGKLKVWIGNVLHSFIVALPAHVILLSALLLLSTVQRCTDPPQSETKDELHCVEL
jgi:hypothetical protein